MGIISLAMFHLKDADHHPLCRLHLVIYQCSNDVQVIFYFQLEREKEVEREKMSVTCKDLIEYVMEQQKVK